MFSENYCLCVNQCEQCGACCRYECEHRGSHIRTLSTTSDSIGCVVESLTSDRCILDASGSQ